MSELVYPAPLRALDANDNPVAGAELRAFRADTTTPLTLYADSAGTTAHPVPLLADANGLFPSLYNTSAFGVRIDVKHPTTGASLPGYPINRAIAFSTATGAAADVSFAPTDDIAETNVQAAIARVQSNWTGAKTGADAGLVSGTPGAANTVGQWNADGDLVGNLLVGVSANNVVQLNGSSQLPAVDGSLLTNMFKPFDRGSYTAVATGSAVDFTSVSAPNELEIDLDAVSLDGTDNILIQLGTGGSPTTTGYSSFSGIAGTTGLVSSTAGLVIIVGAAARTVSGLMTLRHIGSNAWVIAASGLDHSAGPNLCVGRVTLAGALDMVRITRTGTNSFDGSGQARVTGR